MTFALIKRGICVNTVEADQAFMDNYYRGKGYDAVVDCSSLDMYGTGMFYDGSMFLNVEDAMAQGKLESSLITIGLTPKAI